LLVKIYNINVDFTKSGAALFSTCIAVAVMASDSHPCSPLASTGLPDRVRRYPHLAACYVAAPTFAQACVDSLPERVSAAEYAGLCVDSATYVDMPRAMAAHDEASSQALGSLPLSIRARHTHDPRSPEEDKERDTRWAVHTVGKGMCVKRLDVPRAYSSPVVCPVCCDASKYSCLSCGGQCADQGHRVRELHALMGARERHKLASMRPSHSCAVLATSPAAQRNLVGHNNQRKGTSGSESERNQAGISIRAYAPGGKYAKTETDTIFCRCLPG